MVRTLNELASVLEALIEAGNENLRRAGVPPDVIEQLGRRRKPAPVSAKSSEATVDAAYV